MFEPREFAIRELQPATIPIPAEIIKKILQYSSEKGDLVFDPFLGSGQTAVVSKLLKRNYIGFEIVKKYFDFISKRLKSNSYRIKSSNDKSSTIDTWL